MRRKELRSEVQGCHRAHRLSEKVRRKKERELGRLPTGGKEKLVPD